MPKKLTIDQVRKNLESKGHVLLDDVYINSKTRLKYICGSCGKEDQQTYSRLMMDIGHECRGTGLEIMNSKRFKTLYRHQCNQCPMIFYNHRKKGMFCDIVCRGRYMRDHEEYKQMSSNGGKKAVKKSRSKNEILFTELCEAKWGKNNVKSNLKIFDGFDTDVILPNTRICIEWNGIYHYKPIFGEKVFNQVRARDKVKKSIITKKYGWGLYIIKDMGSYNPSFVKSQFLKFCNILQELIKNLPDEYIPIDI